MTWTVLIIFGWIAIIGPGRLDGGLFPVLKDIQITGVAPDPSDPLDTTLVTGTFDKVRRCSARHVEWYLGDRDDLNHLAFVWGPPLVRDLGGYEFGPWVVRIGPPNLVLEGSFADILHQCSVTVPILGIQIQYPWLTRTRFWK